jgi:glycosyltransferase involved in cell wall biosynthesis
MRVAIVHDWLTGMRGGEAVLEALCRLLPDAPLFTLLHVPGSVSRAIEARRIVTSFVQRLPFARSRYRSYLPLFPLAVESFDLSGFDLVVSTSHCVAKGALPPPLARHVCYCHTPVRYAWDRFDDYFGPGSGTGRLGRLLAALVCHYLRAWDAASAGRVDRFVANSRFVAARIRRYYGRASELIHPPVDAARFAPDPRGPEDYYLAVGALAAYKRVGHAIEACARLGRRLVVAGAGAGREPGRRALERRARAAGGRVEFLGRVSDEELSRLYARARGLLFPGVEDFGVTPLESLASGRPVVALAQGGALDSLGDEGEALPGPDAARPRPPRRGRFGVLYEEATPEGLARAIEALEAGLDAFAPDALRARALAFDRPVFEAKIAALLRSEGVPLAEARAAAAPPSPAEARPC